MYIIFLDIDGVLYSSNHYKWLKTKGKRNKDKYGFLFDPKCVKNFNDIIRKTDAKIVISSSWRSGGLKTMQDCFSDRGVKGEIIGLTPIGTIDNLYFCRAEEIKAWLTKNGVPEKFVIIDDMDLGGLENKLYKTKMANGLTDNIKDEIIKYFNS